MADDRSAVPTPILLVGCRRADALARVFQRVREARPARLFVAFDVPVTGPDDPEHRRAVELASAVDWPCAVDLDVADHPLGPTGRIASAIDRAFTDVDRLIVLEDDILVDPSFFPWAGAMLDRYAGDPSIGHIGGRNELVGWPANDDHLLVRRGSMWGWATWRDRWMNFRTDLRPPAPTGTSLLDDHVRQFDRSPDVPLTWDLEWTRSRVATGLRAVIPSRNLVDNIGFGSDATHTFDPFDVRSGFPIGDAVSLSSDDAVGPDHSPDVYDEWAVLVELMSTYRHPEAVARLARLDARRPVPLLDDVTRHHLAPFRRAESSLRALAHLRRQGVDPGRVAPLERAIHRVMTAGATT
jgi:hypothetical protein